MKILHKLSEEPVDQTYACLYLIWCIFYGDPKFGHNNQFTILILN